MDLDHFAGLLSSQLRRPAVPVEQQLSTLKRLSFRFTPELEAHFQSHPESYEDPAYLSLLCRLAQDEPDQALVTVPESPSPDTMYRDLLKGLSALTGGAVALSGGELSPAADGRRTLTFTLKGDACQYEAQDLGGWLDMGLLTHLNGLLAEKGASLEISEETRDMGSGFVLVYGGIEENGDFDDLIDSAYERLQDIAHKALFSADGQEG